MTDTTSQAASHQSGPDPVDMSPQAILKRLRIASALGVACLKLGRARPVPESILNTGPEAPHP